MSETDCSSGPSHGFITSAPNPDAESSAGERSKQKKKGDKKPSYTTEERKSRNREAQSAFRIRRDVRMKDLENEVKRQENTLQTLQQAAEECRDLRYQNALLERMLRENGINFRAEISATSRAPLAPLTNKPSPILQAPMNELHSSSDGDTASCYYVLHSEAALSPEIASRQMTRPAGLIAPGATALATPHRHDQNPTGTFSNLPPYPEHTAKLEQECDNPEALGYMSSSDQLPGLGPYPGSLDEVETQIWTPISAIPAHINRSIRKPFRSEGRSQNSRAPHQYPRYSFGLA